MSNITINGRAIGLGYPVYIVAEISANHNQNIDQAIRLIEKAKSAGADAVKVQTYTPDTMTIDCDNDEFVHNPSSPWGGLTLYELYSKAYMPWDWQPQLKLIAEDLGLDFFSTPFDLTAVDFLESIDVPAYKVASFELVDIPLLRYIASTGKPIILSTGMATLGEIVEAVQAIRKVGNDQIALLKCTSAYPASYDEMNLSRIPHMTEYFGTVIGLSDHSEGIVASITATALKASIIEKHITLSRFSGLDSAFSIDTYEFNKMTEAIRSVEQIMGDVTYDLASGEEDNRELRRSLYIVKDLNKGDVLDSLNVRSIRPGPGLHPRYLGKVIGQRVVVNIPKGTPLRWELLE